MRQGSVSPSVGRSGLGFLIGLVLISDLAVVGVHFLDENTSLVRGNPRTSTAPRILPGPGQAFLSGEIEKLVADKAQGPPLRSPFTITAVERGVGRLSIEKALVNGNRVTISWDGGTPLPISGDGGVELGATHVEADGSGVTWSLDGAARTFLAGSYRAEAPVAVGTGGLATPRDGVEFTADDQTVIASRGEVVVKTEPAKVDLKGPGTLEVTGSLEVQHPDRKASTGSVRFGEGPFQLTLDPNGDELNLDAVLQGEVQMG